MIPQTPRRWLLALSLLLPVLVPAASRARDRVVALARIEILADGFLDPRGIAVDAEDRALVADREAGTITRVAPDGTRTAVATGLHHPVGLAVAADNGVLVAEEQGGRVVRIGPDGAQTALVSGLHRPRWLARRDDGTLYVSVRRVTPATRPEPDDDSVEADAVLVLRPTGELGVFAEDLPPIRGLATDDTSVFVATADTPRHHRRTAVVSRIPVLSDGSAGSPVPIGHRTIDMRHPRGLARDRLGALYVAGDDFSAGGDRVPRGIAKLTTDGRAWIFAENLAQPFGLTFDAAGNLLLADGHSGRVLRFRSPAPPSVDVPAVTSLPRLEVRGSTEPRARVDLLVDDVTEPLTTGADRHGLFAIALTPAPNTTSTLAFYTTTHAGRGLTSAPAQRMIVHDTLGPSLTLDAPPPGAHVRGTVMVQAHAADPGAVASLSLTAGGHPLDAVLTPALPAPSVRAVAAWNTTILADGTHTLATLATDSAGNVSSISRTVVVDNGPPDTVITAGPPDVAGTAPITFAFVGSDAITPSASLEFAWRLDAGAFGPFSSATSTVVSLAPGSHVFEVKARDQAGNEDPTPARRTFVVGSGLRVTISEPADGSTVPTGALLVQGAVEGGGAFVALSVNGLPAAVSGTRWAVEVPIASGVTLLTARATDFDGTTATTTAMVSGGDPASLTLTAVPGGGAAPLDVMWRVTNQTSHSLVRFELDPLGTGAFDAPTSGLDGSRTTYTRPGLFHPTVRATDDQGHVYLASALVHVEDGPAVTARFRALWGAFTARLAAGDQPGALARLAPSLRPRFEPVFQRLAPDLPAIAGQLGDLEVLEQIGDLAETALVRLEDGSPHLYFVYFRRDGRGLWLIEEM